MYHVIFVLFLLELYLKGFYKSTFNHKDYVGFNKKYAPSKICRCNKILFEVENLAKVVGYALLYEKEKSGTYYVSILPSRRCVYISQLIANLSDDALRGVFAHEIGHIKYYFSEESSLAFIIRFVRWISWIVLLLMFFFMLIGYVLSSNIPAQYLIWILSEHILVGLILVSTYITKSVVQRKNEYLADEYSARILNSPKFMISFLNEIYKLSRTSPLSKYNLSNNLFDAHPHVERRIKRLKKMTPK